MNAEAAQLAARLVKGQAWLIAAWDRLLAMPHSGHKTLEEAQFVHEMFRWDALDRSLPSYRGYVRQCIHGALKSCPDNGGELRSLFMKMHPENTPDPHASRPPGV